MSNKSMYKNEIATAHRFIMEHKEDKNLLMLLRVLEFNKELPHSEIWSLCYDWMKFHYPKEDGSIVTGLSYYFED